MENTPSQLPLLAWRRAGVAYGHLPSNVKEAVKGQDRTLEVPHGFGEAYMRHAEGTSPGETSPGLPGVCVQCQEHRHNEALTPWIVDLMIKSPFALQPEHVYS